MFCRPMPSASSLLEHPSSASPDLHVKQLVREALGELADSPLDGEDYNRVVDAFVRRGLI